jgi:hypothetical protein
MPSNNVFGADNQQERLIFSQWIVGFVDGEGCFTVSFFKHPKSRLRLGWQVFPEFVVVQNVKSRGALEKIKEFFQCGSCYLNKRYDNHHEHQMKYVVRNRQDLIEKIIPFFRENSLRTEKQKDFLIFADIICKMEKGEHLTEKGLREIRKMTMKMNTRKYR